MSVSSFTCNCLDNFTGSVCEVSTCGTIIESVEANNLQCVLFRLSQGDDIDEITCTDPANCPQTGITPLTRAVELSNLPMVQFLVENNAGLEVRSFENKTTPLIHAIMEFDQVTSDQEAIVRFLVDSGADVDALIQMALGKQLV